MRPTFFRQGDGRANKRNVIKIYFMLCTRVHNRNFEYIMPKQFLIDRDQISWVTQVGSVTSAGLGTSYIVYVSVTKFVT